MSPYSRGINPASDSFCHSVPQSFEDFWHWGWVPLKPNINFYMKAQRFLGALCLKPFCTALLQAHPKIILRFHSPISAGYWGVAFLLHHFTVLSIAVLSPTHEFLACFVAYYSLGKSHGTEATNFRITRTQVGNLVIRDQEPNSLPWGLWGEEVRI